MRADFSFPSFFFFFCTSIKKYSYLYLAYAAYVSAGSFRRIYTQNTSSYSWAETTDNIGKLLQTSRFYKQINSFNTLSDRFIHALSVLLYIDSAF